MSGCHTACLPPEEPNLCNLKPSHTLQSSQMKECRVFCFAHPSFKHPSFSAVQNHFFSVNSHSLWGWLYRSEWNPQVNLSKHMGTTTIFLSDLTSVGGAFILSPMVVLQNFHFPRPSYCSVTGITRIFFITQPKPGLGVVSSEIKKNYKLSFYRPSLGLLVCCYCSFLWIIC